MFCGECGRSVGAIVSATLAVTPPAENPSVVSRPAGNPPEVSPGGDLCRQCGAPMSPGDIFCGECGSVSHNVSEIFCHAGDHRPREDAGTGTRAGA